MKYEINLEKYGAGNKEKEKETDDNDDYVVKSIGAFGKWQAIVCFVIALSRLIALWNVMSMLFLTPTEFICKKFKDNTTTLVVKNSSCYDQCLEYEFDDTVFEKTFIADFHLICDRAWLASFTQTVLMFGVMIGVWFFGWISDRFGRSKALIFSVALDVIFMLSSPFAPSFWIFTALRFFVGVASGGVMSITAVFTMEIVGPKHREVVGSLALMPDGIAVATLSLFAYFTPTWKVYLLAISGVSLVILVFLVFLPETPRWFVANGKSEQAVTVMTKAAKFNSLTTTDIKDNVARGLKELNLKENESQTYNYWDLFKTKTLTIITMSSFTVWFVTGLCYYGINQYIVILGSNIYVVVAISGAIQVPMSPLASILTKVYGRKATTMGSYIMIGVTMIILIFLPHGTWISTSFALIGILFSSLNFIVIYLFVTELYPTPIRNMGFSFSASGSKFGAMLAPFVASIQISWLASLIFSLAPFIAAAICILLPETKGRKLRDTVDNREC